MQVFYQISFYYFVIGAWRWAKDKDFEPAKKEDKNDPTKTKDL